MKRKTSIRFKVIVNNRSRYCVANYHSKGYMKAKNNHLDISPSCNILDVLFALAKKRGFKAKCLDSRECITIIVPEINYDIALCTDEWKIKCSETIYLMLTRKGNLYISITMIKKDRSRKQV